MSWKTGMATAALFLIAFTATPAAAADGPALHAQAAVLLDGSTGQILFQKQGATKRYPASTTKLLTALVAVEYGDLAKQIRVNARDVALPPDSTLCHISAGEEQSLQNLLYGLLLVSGNDCAMAIADGVTSGHPEQFMRWMNDTASRLGATHSHFVNPHGLQDPQHYTTPMDLALIARAALSNPTVRKISGTLEYQSPGKPTSTYVNHNKMLLTYTGTVGGKTGFTDEAGLTLVTEAKRDGRTLIGVVMGCDSQPCEYGDMTALLNDGFATPSPAGTGGEVTRLPTTEPVGAADPSLGSSLDTPRLPDTQPLPGGSPIVLAFAGAVPPLTRRVFAWVDTGLSRLPVSWVTGLFAFCVIFAVLQGCLYMVSRNQRK